MCFLGQASVDGSETAGRLNMGKLHWRQGGFLLALAREMPAGCARKRER